MPTVHLPRCVPGSKAARCCRDIRRCPWQPDPELSPMSTTTDPTVASKRSPMFWVPTLYFAEGLPYFTVAMIAGLMYKSLGVDNATIGHYTALLGSAWVFKPLWSPFLEFAPNKKPIVVVFQFLGAVSLGLVALSLQMPLWFALTVAALTLLAFGSATHD